MQALQVPEAESSKNFSGQIVRQAGAAGLVESRKKLGLHLEQTVLLVPESKEQVSQPLSQATQVLAAFETVLAGQAATQTFLEGS